jgi:hypothetical protein
MAGTVYIQGSTESLSALGFRFNVGGGFCYCSHHELVRNVP